MNSAETKATLLFLNLFFLVAFTLAPGNRKFLAFIFLAAIVFILADMNEGDK